MKRGSLYSLGLAAWSAAFLALALAVALQARTVRRAAARIEKSEAALARAQSGVLEQHRSLRAIESEAQFLLEISERLPEEKNFLRSQKAIADEVEALRRSVRRWLKDRLIIVVDTKVNKLYLRRGLQQLWEADCSVGRGGILSDPRTGRRWEFVTPRGEFRILSKLEKPAWTRPDWSFVESGQPVPPPNDPARKVEGELGDFVLNLGDGYLIHGTKNEELLGRPVSHGCVRLGKSNLEKLYQSAPIGTRVYIY